MGGPLPRDFLDRWLGTATEQSIYDVSYVDLRPDDDVLSALGCLHTLEILSFSNSRLSIKNVRAIPELPGVVSLTVEDGEGELTAEELAELFSKFPSLGDVAFDECHGLTDEALHALPTCVQMINVGRCGNVTGDFLGRPEGWPELESVVLNQTPIGSATLDAAAQLKNVDTLWLVTTVRDEINFDFSKLAEGPQARRLALWGFGILPEKARELEQQFPNVKWVIRD